MKRSIVEQIRNPGGSSVLSGKRGENLSKETVQTNLTHTNSQLEQMHLQGRDHSHGYSHDQGYDHDHSQGRIAVLDRDHSQTHSQDQCFGNHGTTTFKLNRGSCDEKTQLLSLKRQLMAEYSRVQGTTLKTQASKYYRTKYHEEADKISSLPEPRFDWKTKILFYQI